MNRKRRTIINISTVIVNNMLKTVFPFILRTLVIYRIGEEYVGLGSLYVSVLSVLSLTELGFGTAVTYFMYKPMGEENAEVINPLLNFIRKVFLIVGVIISCVGLCMCPFIDKLIKGSTPRDINIYLLYLIYLLNTVISYYFGGYKKTVLVAGQRNDIDANINSIVYIFTSLAQIGILIIWPNYYAYTILLPLGTLITNLAIAHKVSKMYPEIKSEGDVGQEQKKDIIKKVKALFITRIGTIILTSSDNIVISMFLGLTTIAYYGNYYQIVYAFITLTYMSFGAITSIVANKLINSTKAEAMDFFCVINFVVCMISGIIFNGVFNLMQEFMTIWMGTDRLLEFSTVVLLCIFFYVWQVRRASIVYFDAYGAWDKSTYRPLISAIVNLVLNITLVKIIGINGIVLSTIISMVVIDIPWELYILFKCYFEKPVGGYLVRNIEYLLTIGFATGGCFIFCRIITISGISGLLLRGVLIVVATIITIFVFWRHDHCYKYALESFEQLILGRKLKKTEYVDKKVCQK